MSHAGQVGRAIRMLHSGPAFNAVFGAHGVGQDTILRNRALLNVLWDGGEMAIDRRS